MKKLLLTVMVVGLMGLTACGAEETTEEKAEVKAEYEVVADEAIESSNELCDAVLEYCEEYYASEEYLEEVEYNSLENVW